MASGITQFTGGHRLLALIALFVMILGGTAMTHEPEDFSHYWDGPAKDLPASREALGASLKRVKALTPQMVAHLTEQAAPAVLLVTTPAAEETIPLGGSKIGGAPDLPPGMSWPVRPPYPDAEKKRDRHRSSIGSTLAKAGIAPDWMSPEDGKRYVEEMRKIERDVGEEALRKMGPEAAAMMRPIFEEQRNYTPERAREATRLEALQAQLVGENSPLSFIAQLDLAALAGEPGFDPDLPKHGRLLLFYDLFEQPTGFEPGARVGFRLIWDETPAASLRRAPVPAALQDINDPDWSVLLKPARVMPRSVMTPITPYEDAWDAIPIEDRLFRNEDGKEPYWAYSFWLSRFGSPDEGRAGHQLGGWPRPLQNGMKSTAQLAFNGLEAGNSEAFKTEKVKELMKGVADWKLVLQLGLDDAVGLNNGAYYVLMRREDILARRFNNAWVVYQCT